MRTQLILLCLILSCSALAADVTVLKGRKQATIVCETGAEAETARACAELAAYLSLSTQTEFEVVADDEYTGDAASVIYVGRTSRLPAEDVDALKTLDRDAYLVHRTGDAIHLVGPRPWSTYWATLQFLEDHVGVRWLIPGDLGEDVPRHDRIVIAEGRDVYEPALLSRQWSGAQYGGDWSLRQRIRGRYRFHHNLLKVFDPSLFDEHPEWFPIRGGERYQPGEEDHSWQPCFDTDSSVKHAADAARAAFDADPFLESFSYGCNDGQGWCEGNICKAMDREMESWGGFEGTYSYRYYSWLNRVAAELETTHPDKMVGCLAYSTYILPPEEIGLHRNIIPYLTSNRADYRDPAFREQDQNLLEWWGRVANQVGIYDYAYGMGFAIPRIYNHLFQGAIQHAVENGVRGFYAEVYPNWGLDGHKLWIMSRILWNPTVDIDELTDEWNERMFRQAAAPMKAYFALLERTWEEQDTGAGHWAYRLAADPKQFQIFPPAVLEEATEYLKEAAALAQDQIVTDRIQFFRKTWDVTLMLGTRYWASREVGQLIEDGADLSEVATAMQRMAAQLARTDLDAFMEDRVGDDPVAFHPPKQGWIAPLKGGAETNAKRWAAAQISGDLVRAARTSGRLGAAEMRQDLAAKVDRVFGEGGTPAYRQVVDHVREMTLKVATAVRVETPPVIDGDLGDAVWDGAEAISGFVQWGDASPSHYTTRARLAHDGTDLYIALDCPQDTGDLRTVAAARDGYAWQDDSIELFINPGMDEFPHVQFIVTAGGAFYDQWAQDADQSYQQRIGANFSADWASKVGAGGWTAELRIPLSEFGYDIDTHPLLRIDLVRNVQGDDAEISAWFPSIAAHADPLSRGWVIFQP